MGLELCRERFQSTPLTIPARSSRSQNPLRIVPDVCQSLSPLRFVSWGANLTLRSVTTERQRRSPLLCL